ncbi:hypothetical protein [Rubellimicrobium roseum]|uniref:hypothetical protein n=1 Tax=Rubellimicrobium roseum TaxID=687525 RepID=UPI00159BBBD3|nr:hypothetical protein [Rubellimicrobium roseum]
MRIGAGLVRLADANPCEQALDQFDPTSDEDLAARSTTRDVVIRRISGVRLYL